MENIKNFIKDKTYFPRRFLREININLFVPIAVILTIIPLIVRLVSVRVDEDTADIYSKIIQTDLFSQKKASILLFFSVLLIIISILFFKKMFEKKDKVLNLILISTTIFWIFTLFSAIYSSHKSYAFYGAFDRAEGFITITCYTILLVYSIYTFKNTSNYKYVIIPIIILVFILSFLGIFQYTGHDLINSKLGLFLVLGSSKGKLSLAYETGKLYGTLYHYNYVGSFVAIVLPLLFSLTIFEKNIYKKIILSISSLLSLWLLFGSTSRAGIIGVSVAAICGILIFGRSILKQWKILLAGFICILILAIGLNFATKGAIFERIPGLINDTLTVFKDTSDFDYKEHTPVKDIKHIDGHADVILPNETLKISYENGNYIFKNSKNEIIPYTNNNNIYTTNDEGFQHISFESKNVKSDTKIGYISLKIDGTVRFVFRLGKDNSVHLVNPNNKNDIEIDYPETFGFKGKEKLGSSRAYIWSRAIPLLRNNLLLGSGPDTFIYQFPQNDLIGKYYAYDTPNMIVDKPHNLYLQIALNEGLIALLAFLSIMVIYIIDSMKLYALKREYNYSQVLGAANCLSIVGYLFAGIFNDSVISVAPIFWIILGVGVALNYINRTSNAQIVIDAKNK